MFVEIVEKFIIRFIISNVSILAKEDFVKLSIDDILSAEEDLMLQLEEVIKSTVSKRLCFSICLYTVIYIVLQFQSILKHRILKYNFNFKCITIEKYLLDYSF